MLLLQSIVLIILSVQMAFAKKFAAKFLSVVVCARTLAIDRA